MDGEKVNSFKGSNKHKPWCYEICTFQGSFWSPLAPRCFPDSLQTKKHSLPFNSRTTLETDFTYHICSQVTILFILYLSDNPFEFRSWVCLLFVCPVASRSMPWTEGRAQNGEQLVHNTNIFLIQHSNHYEN